ncbi:ornithine acetyltransferase, partial [Moniliophthora roreri]
MAKVGPSSKGRVHRVSAAFVPSDGTPTLPVLVNGELEKVDEGRASEILKLEDFEILAADFGGGDKAETAKYYTCDFSYVGSKPFKVKMHIHHQKRPHPDPQKSDHSAIR